MGIKGLTVRLESYASPWPPRDQPFDDKHPRPVIIDGPSLAYFIYYRRLKEQDPSLNALDAYPSYEQVTYALLRFLGRLEASNFTIQGIYFDGRLPESKRDTRMRRLQSNLNQLRAFRSAHPFLGAPNEGSQYGDRRHFTNAPGLAASDMAPRRSTPLPALPVLVSAVIEELLASKYGTVTSVVPGEADVYCAKSARDDPRNHVLTSDSDLLVHCSEGCVVLFSDMEASGTGIRIDRCYRPAAIARTLGCTNFRLLAYVMAQDPHMSASQAARTAKEQNSTLREEATHWYDTELLEPQHVRRQLDEIRSSTIDQRPTTSIKDPRISELFYDWAAKTRATQTTASSNNEKPEIRMYLPFLIDDPARASAWRLSVSIRRRAYSLLNKLGRPFTMLEVDRRGIETQEHELPLTEAPFEYEKSFMCDRPCMDSSPSSWWGQLLSEFWKFAQDEVSQTPFTLEALLGLVSRSATVSSWDVVHLKAQLEGYIYSLRLLHFVLRLCSQDANANVALQRTSLYMTYIQLGNMQARLKLGVSPNDPYPVPEASFRKRAYAWHGTTEEEEQKKSGAKSTCSKRDAKQKRQKTEQQAIRLRQRDPNNRYGCLTAF